MVNTFGINTVLFAGAICTIVVGVFFVIQKYIIPFLDSRKAVKKAQQTLFKIQTCVWILVVLFLLTQFMKESFTLTIGLLLFIGAVGINFWIDFFVGIRFRFEDNFKQNDPVRFENFSGEIHKISTTGIELKTEDEELVYINYRKIVRGTLVKRQAKGKLLSSKIVLNIGLLSEEAVVAKVTEWIYHSPWAVSSKRNSVAIQPGGLLHVTVYAVDQQSLGKVERSLKEKILQLKNLEESNPE